MSLGGWLVVLDRAGRDVKQYHLRVGSVTLGSDPACDIRVMVPTVSPHHATVSALYHQTVVRSVSERETLVNGAPVSVAALRHGDIISLGGRSLRWDYRVPGVRRPLAPEPALLRRVQRTRAPRRGSDPPTRKVIVPEHRASMPASTRGKQVAIVQPQRRDTSDLSDAAITRLPPNKRPRISRNNNHTPSAELVEADGDKTKRKSVGSPRNVPNLSNTTKATLWIESRKTSPRKSTARTQTPVKTPVVRKNIRKAASAKKATPLRMAVLRKAQSAQKTKVTKIQAPLKMDSTKQAAIMLMTRHTPKTKQTSPNRGNRGPSFVVKKQSPVKETARNKRSSGKHISSATPMSASRFSHHILPPVFSADDRSASVIEITDSESRSSTRESSVTRRSGKSSLRSPHFLSPKKSALKDPNAKKNYRKTESIKFDLSNLDNLSQNRSSDAMLAETGNDSCTEDSENDFTLRYSDSSTKSPSPRKSINSRSRRMLQNALRTSITLSPKSDSRTLSAESAQPKKSLRGSIMLQEALRINNSNGTEISTYSLRTTKSISDQSWSTTIASTRQTRTLSPRVSRNNLESYSIVDLVSIDSNDLTNSRSGSVYTSADSNRSVTYDTPGSQNLISISRRALGCSTPYDLKNDSLVYELPGSSSGTRKHKARISKKIDTTNTSVTTPENTDDTTKNITLNSTKLSRASKKRFRKITRQNALVFMDDELSEDDSSPKSSKRVSRGSQASPLIPKNISVNETFDNSPSINEGDHTPENRHSPVEASTPVLKIQSLLDASQNLNKSRSSGKRRMSKRKTIEVLRSESSRGRTGMKSNSLNFRRSGRGKEISSNFNGSNDGTMNVVEEVVTPKSAVKLLPEGVKNKHSSAKKPQSKRSLIDNLNESDIVKQLFNSPVKRKLSQSMTEFSRRHLFNDGEDRPKRSTRATVAVAGRSFDHSLLDHTEPFTPEIFVSPLNTPSNSPKMTGIKRLFQKNTPENDLRNVRGVKGLFRTPRNRKSIKNDLSNVSGVKTVFAKSPRNRLSNVRVKEIFNASPKNDLREVSGVKNLFQSQKKKARSPRNELSDMRGVRTLFKDDSPRNDLRNVSGLKRTLQCKSPRNDLTDIRGVKQMFRQEKQRNELADVSGVEELFHESANYDSTFDQLLGRPPIRAVYTKSKSFTTTSKLQKRGKNRQSKSLHDVSLITNNVEEWLQKELMERLRKNALPASNSNSKREKPQNKSKNISKTTRELQKLNTDTIDGSAPVIISRTRNSSIVNSVQSDLSSRKKSASEVYGAHTLPIKKRSLVEVPTSKSNIDKSHKLPIKKRAVVHSTPVKGRVNITMNASEIGRMSPISSEDKTEQMDNIIRSPQRQVYSNTKIPPGKTKVIVETASKENTMENPKLSPKKIPSAKTSQISPASMRTRRGGKPKPENQEVLNVKRRRSSIIITKKTPVLSPKAPNPKITRKRKTNLPHLEDAHKFSPKKTRSMRGQKSQVSVDVKTATPIRNTRAKLKMPSVVVKPSPKLNPRVTRRTKDKIAISETNQRQLQTKRTRKVSVTETGLQNRNKRNKPPPNEGHIDLQSKNKFRKTVVESEVRVEIVDKSSTTSTIIQTRRTRKMVLETAQHESTTEKSKLQNKKNRKVTDGTALEKPKSVVRDIKPPAGMVVPVTRSGRKIKADLNVPRSIKGRGRKTAVNESAKTTAKDQIDGEVLGIQPTRSRKFKQEIRPADNKDTTELPTRRGRKRKITERDDPVTKDNSEKKKTRSTKKTKKEDKDTKDARTVRNTKKAAGDVSDNKTLLSKSTSAERSTKTRSTRSAAGAVDRKPVKGKKTTSTVESITEVVGRNKRTDVKISDAKENMEPRKKPRKAAVTSPARRATRARNNTAAAARAAQAAQAGGGRGRRR